MVKYTKPEFHQKAFNCPHCQAYANQKWEKVLFYNHEAQNYNETTVEFECVNISICDHCNLPSIWYLEQMVHPVIKGAPTPHQDLPEDMKKDYEEARYIVSNSPRGACALLRLIIQKLCKELGERGNNINDDIASLVKKGLPIKIQQSLDIVRVVGNNAVHPGKLDLIDDINTATIMFELVNLIVGDMITKPREIDRLYNKLPQSQRDAINKRDNP